jgi:hypothetical protein
MCGILAFHFMYIDSILYVIHMLDNAYTGAYLLIHKTSTMCMPLLNIRENRFP